MKPKAKQVRNWIRLGIFSGLLSSAVYPALLFLPLPFVVQLVLMMAWGPLLGLSAAGFYYFLALHRETISSRIGLVSQIIAGVLVTLMLIVQSAVKLSRPETIDSGSLWVWNSINHVQLGIDVAWDLFIFLATVFFAVSMFHHPKLGKILSLTGIGIASALMVLNVLAFPTPPAEANSIDLGPLLGLWGLALAVMMWKGLGWVDMKLNEDFLE